MVTIKSRLNPNSRPLSGPFPAQPPCGGAKKQVIPNSLGNGLKRFAVAWTSLRVDVPVPGPNPKRPTWRPASRPVSRSHPPPSRFPQASQGRQHSLPEIIPQPFPGGRIRDHQALAFVGPQLKAALPFRPGIDVFIECCSYPTRLLAHLTPYLMRVFPYLWFCLARENSGLPPEPLNPFSNNPAKTTPQTEQFPGHPHHVQRGPRQPGFLAPGHYLLHPRVDARGLRMPVAYQCRQSPHTPHGTDEFLYGPVGLMSAPSQWVGIHPRPFLEKGIGLLRFEFRELRQLIRRQLCHGLAHRGSLGRFALFAWGTIPYVALE